MISERGTLERCYDANLWYIRCYVISVLFIGRKHSVRIPHDGRTSYSLITKQICTQPVRSLIQSLSLSYGRKLMVVIINSDRLDGSPSTVSVCNFIFGRTHKFYDQQYIAIQGEKNMEALWAIFRGCLTKCTLSSLSWREQFLPDITW